MLARFSSLCSSYVMLCYVHQRCAKGADGATAVFGCLMWGEAKLFMVKTVTVNHHRPCHGALPGPDRDPATLCAHPYRR